MKSFGEIAKYMILFVGTYFLLLGLLVLSAKIPREKIMDKLEESADYMCGKNLYYKVGNSDTSIIDIYSDSILLNIAYHFDDEAPLTSVMKAEFYRNTVMDFANKNLKEAISDNPAVNAEYLRYWHGSLVIIRPLLTILNVREMYILNTVVLIGLFLLLMFMLIRRKYIVPAVGFVLASLSVSIWFVSMDFEYIWMFLIMLACSIISVKFSDKDRAKGFIVLMLIMGMVTNFIDFLTVETLSLSTPLLLTVWIMYRRNKPSEIRDLVLYSVKACIAWLIGYGGMWTMKWITAAIVLKKNVLPYVTGHIEERLVGNYEGSIFSGIFTGLWKNISSMAPWDYGAFGVVIGILIVIIIAYYCFVYKVKKPDKNAIVLFALVGLIPYIRYIIMINHSNMHWFYTYRAQFVTVLAIVMICAEIIDFVTAFGRPKN